MSTMKREGRQHGMVRARRVLPDPSNPRPQTRHVKKIDSPPTTGLFTKVPPTATSHYPRPQTRHVNKIDSSPTAGSFTKVPTKPTNHSKFTGKCGKPRCNECHIHPASKAKDKTKGNQKFKSSDVAWNHRSVSWRVVHGQPGLNYFAFSATEILDDMIFSGDYDSNDDGEIDGYDGSVDDRIRRW